MFPRDQEQPTPFPLLSSTYLIAHSTAQALLNRYAAIFSLANVPPQKNCAYAIAGQITETLRSSQKSAQHCGYYEIHASRLMEESSKELIKKLQAETPCVLIIDELDWLFRKQHYTTKTINELVDSLSSNLKPGKKEFLVVIGITENEQDIPTSFLDQTKMTGRLHFALPGLEERFSFFQKKLAVYSAAQEPFDIHYLAGATQGCSYEKLTTLYMQALAAAHLNQSALSPAHLEAEIDSKVRLLIPDGKEINSSQRRFKAACLAGQIVAHYHLFPFFARSESDPVTL